MRKIIFAIIVLVAVGALIVSVVLKKQSETYTIPNATANQTYMQTPVGSQPQSTSSEKNAESFIPVQAETQPVTAPLNKIKDYAYAYAGFEPAYANVNIEDWKMLLVNRDYILPDDYEVKLAPCITDDSDSLKLDYRVAPHYNEMYLAALKDGIELTPVSGYRSVERQTRNFNNKIQKYIDEGYSKIEATQMAARIILPPGTSEHNAGLAMDICSLYTNFENSDEFAWLSENAADYGFILRYPEDKQDITNITYEPWHWRYVGVEAAKEMKASSECFEEYLGVS